MQASYKILIVGPAWVGDMTMAQTLFALLKQRQPNTLIDVLAPAWSQPILQRMPEVRQSWEMPVGHGQLRLGTRYRIAKKIQQEKYDQAIVLPNSFKSALIPWFAHIPLRTGWRGEMRLGILNDARRLDKKRLPMMVQRFAALAFPKNAELPDALPYPRLRIDASQVENTLVQFELSLQKPILALCPGAEFGSAKQWPPGYYAQVAKAKLAEGWQVWLFGSPNDKAAAEQIQQQTHHACINLVGRTQLTQAVDLLSVASCVFANDSGLMHIAAALERPLIVMYGSTDPAFAPPLSLRAKILGLGLSCSPCAKRECPLGHHACMNDLRPEQALEAMEELGIHESISC